MLGRTFFVEDVYLGSNLSCVGCGVVELDQRVGQEEGYWLKDCEEKIQIDQDKQQIRIMCQGGQIWNGVHL
jgi:hypothetical protein